MGVRAILPRPEGRGLTRIPINNQHTTAVCGEGLPTLAALRKIAEDLQLAQWQETVREVHEAVASWVKLAAELKVPKPVADKYRRAIEAGPCFTELIARS